MMVRVPAGPFTFGMTAEQKESAAREAGVHPDQLLHHSNRQILTTREFWIDRYPVTRGQFLRFMKATGHKIEYNGWLVGWSEMVGHPFANPAAEAAPAWAGQANLPMTGVNSDDAAAYAKWAGKRLPTEIEWEKAARGTDGRLFPWGNTWKDAACPRNPGNLPLDALYPVGSFPEGASPYGAMDMAGSVLQWVQIVITPVAAQSGHADSNIWFFAGSSPLHSQAYTHMATGRKSWAQNMRIYDVGFRCAADAPPEGLIAEPKYSPGKPAIIPPVAIRKDLYLKQPIRLEPTRCATFKIFVPWFPQSMWAVDCPEVGYGPFGGANDWPYKDEKQWKIDWKVENGGRRISYSGEKDGKKLDFEAWADGPCVEYKISGEGLGKLNLAGFCSKTFSPFFSSQERVTQNRLTDGKLVRCLDLPVGKMYTGMFAWGVGDNLDPGAAIYRSYDGSAFLIFAGAPGCSASGNGWVPCTHLGGNVRMAESGGGRIAFIVGSLEDARQYMTYP